LQSSHGLYVPVDKLENYERNKLIHDTALLKLQERMKNVIALIIDEYSMISSNLFFWTSTRVQEATNCHGLIFGRLPTIIFGDPGQLPPVAGTQLWCSQTISNRALKPLALQGHNIYEHQSSHVFDKC